MKFEYRKFDKYINLKNDHKARMHALVQKEVSLKDIAMFKRCGKLWKIKKYNINKAMKRLQLYKARNIEIDKSIERIIKRDYNEIFGVKNV